MENRTIYWHENRTLAIVKEGRKYAHGLSLEADRLRVVRVPTGVELPPVLYHGKPYPITRAVKHYRPLARSPETSKAARRLFREFARGGAS